ncbi:type VI secretion system membrane subunit TssM [Celerinatantimonas sp. YJH-8]|uniref:type VI secretion system membrane subunit TssM n=1 Tax=Celerinatantimonas sp. YJH-8 TaxID=3228714 RepID=UPI0038C98E65
MPLLVAAIFILVHVAIWWAGPWLSYHGSHPLSSVLSRSLASALWTLLLLGWWGFLQWRRLHDMQEEQSHQVQLQADPIQRYEERQRFELDQVMQNMQHSLNRRNYLYALPWYLVLGLEKAGKTSLINRSGQNFVFSNVMRASGRKSENPYSFDWWIGDDSVLIDPDGELLTQRHNEAENDGELERRLWLNFIQWLEQTRSRRPLNGVVLALDISHLATASVSERRAYASLIRARLRELMENLATRMPVYVTLTKLDLLYGFEPFFQEYTKEQRDEVLGFTFTLDSVENFDRWLEEFSSAYQQFIERLNRLLPKALQHAEDAAERTAIYSFTRQLAGLFDVLSQFFQDALASDQFSTSALVRGVYFTSVYQQGVPTDAFVDAAARRYGLGETINSAQDADNSTTFFTRQLFERIVYPEAGLASDNFRAAKHKRKLMTLSTLTCVIASVLLVGGWQRYYLKNSHQADEVLNQVAVYKQQYAGIDWQGQNEQSLLAPLNMLRDATLAFGFYRERTPVLADMGLYQGATIGPKVETSYLGALKGQYLPVLMRQVIADLTRATDDEQRLSLLRVYRMMTDQSGRRKSYVENYFSKVWQTEYPGQPQTQQMLMSHLDYAMEHTNLEDDRSRGIRQAQLAMQPYASLIEKTQQQLSQIPVAERVYRNLKQSAELVLGAPLDLPKAIGPVFNIVFAQGAPATPVISTATSTKHTPGTESITTPSTQTNTPNRDDLLIPQLFTQKGFNDYFLPQLSSVSGLALIDSWVLGERQNSQYSEADKDVLRERIRDFYIADYTNYWRNALGHVDIKYFTNMDDAINVLDHVSGSMQPLSRLLQSVQHNTQLFPNLPKDDSARMALLQSHKYAVAARIAEPFNKLNALLLKSGDQPAYMNEVVDAVNQLDEYLKAIQSAPNMGKAALDATKARLTLENSDPIYTVQRIASNLPSPMKQLVDKLADESWFVLKQEAIRYLQDRWQQDVYTPYQQKLASRYPFDPRARKDVSLKDFEDFFAPDGTLSQFYDHQLKMFFDENVVLTDSSGKHQQLINAQILQQIHNAEKIQHAFFNRKGVLDVEFSLEPLGLSGNKIRSIINIDGQYVEYSHGAQSSVELVWPNSLRDAAMTKLTLVPTAANVSPRSITIQGPWSFFRLLRQGRIVGASSTSVDYQFNIDKGQMVYRLTSEVDGNPFTDALFKSFRLPQHLY